MLKKKYNFKHTLCKIALDLFASFPPFKRSPFPLRTANEAICNYEFLRGRGVRKKTALYALSI